MDRKAISVSKGEDAAKIMGEYLMSKFDVDGNTHRRSCIILPGYDIYGNLVCIDIHVADESEDEKAYPLFLGLETAASM